jgi:hypothetical protein
VRVRAGIAAPLIAVALGLAACGGDDDDGVSPAPGAPGAEQTVKDFLTAEFEGDSEAACGYVSEDFQQQLAETFGSCEQVIDLATQQRPTFEDVPIEVSEIEDLDLDTKLNGDEKALVTGPRGKQAYRLEVIDGEWTITFISTD